MTKKSESFEKGNQNMKKHFDITDRLGGESELGEDKHFLGGYGGEVGSLFGKIKSVGRGIGRSAKGIGTGIKSIPGSLFHHPGPSWNATIDAANTDYITKALTVAGISVARGTLWGRSDLAKAIMILKGKTITVGFPPKTYPVNLAVYVTKMGIKRSKDKL
jgi:hypothetical protein